MEVPEPPGAEPMPCMAWGMWRMSCAWVVNRGNFSFVGLRDRSAGVWAWVGLHPGSQYSSSDLWGTGGGFLLCFIFVDGREMVGLSDFGLPDARVELSRCTTDKAIWDWGPPSNVLLLGCASSDR